MAGYEIRNRTSRWFSVAFLQGAEADAVLGLIDRSGASAAFDYLQPRDLGEATTDAALENGYAYDRIPAGRTDHIIEHDGSPYALTYSRTYRYVSLLRCHPLASELKPTRNSPRRDDIWAVPRSTRQAERTVTL
ncbi:hypothetical protein [Cryobacterium luteum]|uniref:Uncharacterized protein n=1 Tax=Cryobacterium luteum TaxID=1424661 RepID=A0A1H8DIB5_9MICO|nr:hypothetical protein [Cryobacterium luteum]TFB82482.1 hypothetical protein E3O10_17290 [Cryobacterium luteum]SEN06915.1 hypothetical protein SAMN05216281_103286 [Cryobacterium luteum]